MSVEFGAQAEAAYLQVQGGSGDHAGGDGKLAGANEVRHVEDRLNAEDVSAENRVDGSVETKASGTTAGDKSCSAKQTEGPHKVELIAKDVQATVKWYNGQMHYGFLVRTDTQREVFVHRNSIVMSVGELPWLNRNQPVMFDLWTLPCGRFDAKNVRSSSGQPITFGDPASSGLLGPNRPPFQSHPSSSSQYFRRQPSGFAYPRSQAVMPFQIQYDYYCPVCGRSYDYPSYNGRPRGGSSFKPSGMFNTRVGSRC